MRKLWWLPAAAALAVAACDSGTGPSSSDQPEPAVFAMTNAASNAVVMYKRDADGNLSAGRAFSTRGAGTGASLGSQGALAFTRAFQILLAADAGSNEVSVFRVHADSLEFLSKVSSGGTMPVSIASRYDVVYVLNAGGAGNVAVFQLGQDGTLTPQPGATVSLSTTASPTMPAQVGVSSDGGRLIVTEKATNKIDVFLLTATGIPATRTVNPSVGQTPFGFAFAPSGTLVVSEAFAPGGTPVPDGSALSSYESNSIGSITPVSSSVPTTETAACWVVITSDGRRVYTSNTGSNSITGFTLSTAGALTRLTADGRTAATGLMPVELALTVDSGFLYALNTGDGTINAFKVNADGTLSPRSGASGLPVHAYGMTAY